MNPPKLIYVGPTDVKVKFKRRLTTDTLVGEFIEDQTAIELRKDQSVSGLRDTLLHEALHAVVYLAGLRVALELTHKQEERLVVTLAPWVLALLRDNPKLVEFLLENREREY